TADQLLYPEPELDHVQRTFGRAVAPNPVAVRDDQCPFVQVSRRCRAHRSMWNVDGAGNVTSPVGLRRSRIDKMNLVSSSKSLVQIKGVNFVLKFRLVIPYLIIHIHLLSRSASATRRIASSLA